MSMTRSEAFWSYVVVEKYMDKNGIDYEKAYEALAKRYDDVCDELQSKLDIAVEALEFVVKNSGASADYNLKARQALEKING